MLHYVHIQGRHAPSFSLRNQSGQNFHSLLQEIADGPVAIISTKHRTDIIITSDSDPTAEVIKVWELYLGHPVDATKLVYYTGKVNIFQKFFSSLVSLSKVRKWYKAYLEEFRQVCSTHQNNPIILDLIACEKFLQKNKKTIDRPPFILRPLVKSSKSVLSDLTKGSSGPSLN